MLNKSRFQFSTPAYYTITVSEKLNASIREQIGNFVMTEPEFSSDESGKAVSGLFKDQAALAGLLNTLYNQHYTILSVKRIEDKITELSEQ